MDRMQRIVGAGLLFLGIFGTGIAVAQMPPQNSADSRKIAEALLEYGRAHNDPESIIAAVGIFAKSTSHHQSASLDLNELLSEAMALRPDDKSLVAFADRVAHNSAAGGGAAKDPPPENHASGKQAEDDDEEKSRQAPAFLQQRTVTAPPVAAPADRSEGGSKGGSTGGSKGGSSGADSGDSNGGGDSTMAPETVVIPAYQYTFIEVALTVGLLVFGAVLVGLQVLLMVTQRRYWDDWSIKVTGLTLVITSGLLLIVAGYSEEQAAPMMGMLGTVAGYLLGKEGNS